MLLLLMLPTSATSCTECRPAVRVEAATVKLSLVRPLLVTVLLFTSSPPI